MPKTKGAVATTWADTAAAGLTPSAQRPSPSIAPSTLRIAMSGVYNPSVARRSVIGCAQGNQNMRAAPSVLRPQARTFSPNATPVGSIGAPAGPTVRPGTPEFADLAAGIAQMKIDTNNDPYYVASLAPTPSTVSVDWRLRGRNASQRSILSTRVGFSNHVVKVSNYKRQDFALGDIISIPFHSPNQNPNVDAKNDVNFVHTIAGPVYSKRRMVIILYIYSEHMFYLPLYTWSKRGISSRPRGVKGEYVGLKDATAQKYDNKGSYPPIVAASRKKAWHPATSIHLTGGGTVECKDDIAFYGRVEKPSYLRLRKLYKDVVEQAEGQPYREFRK